MTGDCHVRFCESRGAQSPRPLTKKAGAKAKNKGKTKKRLKGGRR